MAEVKIDVKVNGLTQIKQDLKALKGELVNATDPAEIERLSKAAGQLSDKITDASERIKVFSAGSDFEKVSNGLGLIGDQLSNLDFEGARDSAKLLTDTIKGMDPKAVIAGFKAFASTIGQLGNAFFQMGLKLLANPLFLLIAVITAIVVGIVLLKDKVKILSDAFDIMIAPIKLLIQFLKDLADEAGLTSFALEESTDKIVASNERQIESLEKVSAKTEKEYARQIALAKAKGEDTTQLELDQLKKQEKIANDKILLAGKTIVAINKLEKEGANKLTEDQIKNRNEAIKLINDEYQIREDAKNAQLVLVETGNTKRREENKKSNAKELADEKEFAKMRIQIARQIQDLEVELLEDGIEKEIKKNEIKYARLIEDVNKNEKITSNEKKRLVQLFFEEEQQQKADLFKKEEKRLKDESDKLKKLEQDRLKELADVRKMILDKIEDARATDKERELKAVEDEYQKDVALIRDKYKGSIDEIQKGEVLIANLLIATNQKKLDIGKKYKDQAIEDTKKKQQEKFDAFADEVSKYAQIATDVLGSVGTLLNEADENRLSSIESATNAQLNALEDRKNRELSNANLTESQKIAIQKKYEAEKFKIEQENFKKTEEIKKKQFARDKALRITMAVIDTASAVVQSIANNGGAPAGLAFGAIAAALGAIQIATIAGQKYEGETGPTAPSTPSVGGSSSAPSSPSVNTQRNTNSSEATPTQSVGSEQPVFVVKAVVSETEITATQNKISRIEQSASL